MCAVSTWLVQGIRNIVVVLKESQYGSSLLQSIVSLALLYSLLPSPDPDLDTNRAFKTRAEAWEECPAEGSIDTIQSISQWLWLLSLNHRITQQTEQLSKPFKPCRQLIHNITWHTHSRFKQRSHANPLGEKVLSSINYNDRYVELIMNIVIYYSFQHSSQSCMAN